MRYSNHKCDGCERVFLESDDIVVCPICATPQHRECYNKNGGCVNAHLHSEDFQWQGEKVASQNAVAEISEEKHEETKNDLICPNCQHPNPHGSTACEKCGMKFTIFGINLAEKAQQEEEKEREDNPINPHITPKMTPPPYPPPFKVGSDKNEESEENERPELPVNQEQQMENFLSSTIANASGYDASQGSDTLFKGPFPDDMKIDGISANTMGAFVARDSQKYLFKFKRISEGHKLSFNWAAFFLSPYWFFYRKQIKPGIIFMTLQLCLSIIMTPSATAFLEFNEYISTLDTAGMTEAALSEIMMRMGELMAPMLIFFAIEVVLKLICGFIANPLYRSYTVKHLREVEAEPNRNQKLTRILKHGGISPIMPLAAYFAEQILSLVASFFF